MLPARCVEGLGFVFFFCVGGGLAGITVCCFSLCQGKQAIFQIQINQTACYVVSPLCRVPRSSVSSPPSSPLSTPRSRLSRRSMTPRACCRRHFATWLHVFP